MEKIMLSNYAHAKARFILLNRQQKRIVEMMGEVEKFISDIEKKDIRDIFTQYYMEYKTWLQVSVWMNDKYSDKVYTEDSCRQKHDRFLNKYFD